MNTKHKPPKSSEPWRHYFSEHLLSRILTLCLLLLIASCTTQYYGHTQEEWESMTPFEQEKAKVEWREVIAAKEKGALGDPRSEISEGFVDYSRSTDENTKDNED